MADAYLIDANVFVQAKNLHYRFEFCGGFWHWLESAHAAGLVFSVDKVRSELVAGRKGDPARTWAEQQPSGFFLPDASDAAVMRHYGALMQWASTGGHYTPAAISEFAASKNADPFIVAVAKAHKCTVVTQEKGGRQREAPGSSSQCCGGLGREDDVDLRSAVEERGLNLRVQALEGQFLVLWRLAGCLGARGDALQP